MRCLSKTVLVCVALTCAATGARANSSACAQEIAPGGGLVVTRFLAAPLPRAHEVIADAMQAAGVFLFKNTDELVEGERTVERVGVLHLPHGDEAVRAELAPSVQDGKTGTQVRVETLRREHKKGVPKHAWSAAVVDQAACLVPLLSLDDPLRRPRKRTADGPEVQLADSTQLAVRSRHFLFSAELKANQVVPFETAEDVVINHSVAIPAGSLVAASVVESSDIGEFGRGAKGKLRFRYLVLPDGTRFPLRGFVVLRGKGADFNKFEKGLLIAGSFAARVDMASGTGSGFAVRAGTLFRAEVEGEQKFRISLATATVENAAEPASPR